MVTGMYLVTTRTLSVLIEILGKEISDRHTNKQMQNNANKQSSP